MLATCGRGLSAGLPFFLLSSLLSSRLFSSPFIAFPSLPSLLLSSSHFSSLLPSPIFPFPRPFSFLFFPLYSSLFPSPKSLFFSSLIVSLLSLFFSFPLHLALIFPIFSYSPFSFPRNFPRFSRFLFFVPLHSLLYFYLSFLLSSPLFSLFSPCLLPSSLALSAVSRCLRCQGSRCILMFESCLWREQRSSSEKSALGQVATRGGKGGAFWGGGFALEGK